MSHVHGVGVDSSDGTLFAASHHGLFEVPENGEPTRVANRYQDTMGFTVAGPGHFLGSGHPDERERLPQPLGLVESMDGGATWKVLSLGGEADFHALEYKHERVYGFDAMTGRLMVSGDKKTWEQRAELPMADLAVSSEDPDVVIATTEQGLARSSDGGKTFEVVAGAPSLYFVSWPAKGALFGAAVDGGIHVSADGGATWQQRGRLDSQPEALTGTSATELYAATATGIHASADGGRTFTHRYSAQ